MGVLLNECDAVMKPADSVSYYSGYNYTIVAPGAGEWGSAQFTANSLGYIMRGIPHGNGWKKLAVDTTYYGTAGSPTVTLTNTIVSQTYTSDGSTHQASSQSIITGLAASTYKTVSVTNTYFDDISPRDLQMLVYCTNTVDLVEAIFRSVDN